VAPVAEGYGGSDRHDRSNLRGFLLNHSKIWVYIENALINCMNIQESGQHKFDWIFASPNLKRLKIGLLIF
jgi:hypothetical protein